MAIYDGIYDVVASNMKAADQEFGYNKTTFLTDICSEPQVIDVAKYIKLANPDFLQAVFVNAFKRLPDEKEMDMWEKYFDEESSSFQSRFLRSVSESTVIAINHMRIVNNPYFNQRRGFKYHAIGLLYGLTDKSYLREFGKKMPMPIQKIIRKVFL